MSTKSSRLAARLMLSPSVVLLLIWMIVPLVLTLWFSFRRYNLMYPDRQGFNDFGNYTRFVMSSDFGLAVLNTLILVGAVLVITVVLGILIALLIERPMWGQGVVRILVISPFFIMPPVAALIWKNMFFNPTNGLFGEAAKYLGLPPFDFLGQAPLASIILIVSWQWLPFATLILLTALQSLSGEELEAAEMDGAPPVSRFFYIILPHLARSITVVVLIQTIFLLGVFGEILVTTQGGPGSASTTLPYLIFKEISLDKDVGTAAAGGVVAVILANIVAIFLMRAVGKNLDA
ncbi:carbohydrate ABC transporter permease [Pseudogemmobacter blasticus]|uniref:Sugar ABC transporter permease n=1 Tax=Fuscovulum blasticum DSM 2131 TaxID=1188250 RepID=A0A2T4JCM1_FUSBL|nr:sugar ABC transporter permease [Fuscovulum blasticum]AWD21414.1 sugar ABC transporter permease [Fuscovulum blasticum]PTE15654.1 sugar ABC transporter permease [Fuscovulum blasticum DSM 2131]